MASGDTCIIKVRGQGGHGALPHKAVDAIVAASSIVLALQTIVSRNVDPLHAGIVSVGAFHAGDAPNVLPDEAELRLTVRAFRPEVRDLLEKRIGEIARAQAAVHGASAEVDYQRRYPVLNNHARQTEFCKQVIRDWLGPDGLKADPEPVSASEDFAFFLERVPGCYVFIGNGEGVDGGCSVHNPGYDFNDRVLSTGASYWVRLASLGRAEAERHPRRRPCSGSPGRRCLPLLTPVRPRTGFPCSRRCSSPPLRGLGLSARPRPSGTCPPPTRPPTSTA
jgi:hippurate hydrolase